jgi:hypothetical protein
LNHRAYRFEFVRHANYYAKPKTRKLIRLQHE